MVIRSTLRHEARPPGPAGVREPTESWLNVPRRLIRRGMDTPRSVVADGAFGLAAIAEPGRECKELQCWNLKLTNVLDPLLKKEQPAASELLCKIPASETVESVRRLLRFHTS